MIISISRRTDIPAYFSDWFFHRLQAGYCLVPNPFNPRQVSRISLQADEVDCFVFWTRNPAPMLSRIARLDEAGYAYYFLVTVVDYQRQLEPGSPALTDRLDAFKALAEIIGPERVIWRYDPILFGPGGSSDEHLGRFRNIAAELSGRTERVIISAFDPYPKAIQRLSMLVAPSEVKSEPDTLRADLDPRNSPDFGRLLTGMADAARENNMQITSCAESYDMSPYDIHPGACVDAAFIRDKLHRPVSDRKDPAQRKRCRCAPSRDIGMYDTCPAGCRYCYATGNAETISRNFRAHDPVGESLIPL